MKELIVELTVGVLIATFIGYTLGLWGIPNFVAILAMFVGSSLGIAIRRKILSKKQSRKQ